MSSTSIKKAPPAFDPAVVQKHLEDGAREGVAPGRAIPDVPLAKYVNHTPFPSQYFQSVDQHGELFHVVALRITYDMHHTLPDGSLAYAAEQTPLASKDEWSGAVNESSPLWESDYAPHKPQCDVLVVNAVSRPPLATARRWPCGVALQWREDDAPDEANANVKTTTKNWNKQLMVTGARRFGLINLSEPEASGEVAISWQNAFGGQDKRPRADERKADGSIKKAAGSERWDTDERNPVGAGLNKASGEPGPQLEVMGKPYTAGFGQDKYPPVSLGPLGKAWMPRRSLAGTYDDAWLKNQWPLPPMDFDYGYWNAAPADQQVDYLPPGTKILLVNLYAPSRQTPNPPKEMGETWERSLPMHQFFVRMVIGDKKNSWGKDIGMDLDTLVVDLATQRIYATHRFAVAQSELDEEKGFVLRSLVNRMSPIGEPERMVPPEQLGPLGKHILREQPRG